MVFPLLAKLIVITFAEAPNIEAFSPKSTSRGRDHHKILLAIVGNYFDNFATIGDMLATQGK